MERFLIKKSATAGRNQNCDIILQFPTISGVHCRFFVEGDSLFVQDLFSKNGTIVNRKKIKKSSLMQGDTIDLGGVKLQVEFENGNWYILLKTADSNISFNKKPEKKDKVFIELLRKIKNEINCDGIYLFERQNKSVVLKELLADDNVPPPSRTIIKYFLTRKTKESLWAMKDLPLSSDSITNLQPFSVLVSQFSVHQNSDLWFYCYFKSGCKKPQESELAVRNCFLDFYEIVKDFVEEETRIIKEKVYEKTEEAKDIKYAMVGMSQPFFKVKELALKAAATDFPVLIIGKSGTGKELFARFIHENSKRVDKPFVIVNCPAIPGTLAETELFGHKKGAFTDAREDRIGKLKLADGGTLFLDQVESLSINIQSKLLRFMQEKEFERVGDNLVYQSDVRIIAATNENPETLISEGRMRADFYFRIAYLPLEIPSLSERREDIPLLCDFFLKKHKDKINRNVKGFSKSAIEFLSNIKLTGNIRELENLVCRIATFVESEIIDEKEVRRALILNHTGEQEIVSELFEKTYKDAKEGFEALYLDKLLERADGNITKAAEISGLTRKSIYQLIKKFGK
ncbi:MAG: sigma 54-interacting transcriptional regulator [Acidobacteriota bacterium]